MNSQKMIPSIRLVKDPGVLESKKVNQSWLAAEMFRRLYDTDIELYESMWMMTVNRANITTGYCRISQGGMAGTVADVRIIAKYAIESMASGVILCHNHPSGNIKPSHADEVLTTKVRDGLRLLDIELLDHIILAPATAEERNPYFSFSDDQRL